MSAVCAEKKYERRKTHLLIRKEIKLTGTTAGTERVQSDTEQ